MKRKFTFLLAALLLMSGLTWAQTGTIINWTAADQGYTNAQEITEVVFDDNVTGAFDKGEGTNAPKYYTTGAAIRCYSGNTITITSTDANLTSIVLTFASGENANAITTDVGTYADGTWTGDAESVTFTIGGTTGHRRIAAFAITYGGEAPTPTAATPTFSPAEGTYTEAQSVEISCTTEGATIYYTLDGNDPTTSSTVYSSAITINETTTVKAMAAKDNMNNSSVASATYTINLPYSGDDYVRINSLNDLTDGARVIIAARYDETETAYYAMSNTTTGKPTGVAFTSTASTNGEALPAAILDYESSYYWTVNVTEDGYTFTNASNSVLGYSTGTNFATGGNNTVWTIVRATSGNTAMVDGYEAFCITNKNIEARGIALNNQHNFGPYAISNNNSNDYNFYLDFFVQGAEPVHTPSISANNVEIAYDATSGSFDFTLNNAVEGGQISISTVENWISETEFSANDDGYTATFTTEVNPTAADREGIITLSYTYNTNQTVTKTVTITQAGNPNVFDNISSITGAGDYRVKGMVVATSSKGFIIGDGTGYVYTYLNAAPSYEIGDNLSITGTTDTSYGHVIQFKNTATIETVTETNYNGDPQPTVITEVPNYSEGNHLSTYLEFEGTLSTSTSSNGTTTYYNVAIGNSQIRISYPTDDQVTALTDLLSKTVRVHGFFTGISGTNGSSVFTAMMESVEEVVSTEPSITLDDYTIEVASAGGEATLTVQYENIDEIIADIEYYEADGTTVTTAYEDWFSAEIDTDNNVEITVMDNDGEARTAYFKVYALVGEEYVYSNLVTVNQAAYEAPATTGTIAFGNNGTKINAASVTGDDSMGNSWTITTEGTTSFTQNAEYSQVGKSAEPATSITFTTTLPQEATITAFSAKFGGFNGTAGDVSLNVGETEVGSGSLNGTADVVVENTQTATGTVLTVTVTNIAKGVKCYYISYSISLGTDPIITVPISVNLASDATEGEFTYSIINPVAGVTLSATSTDEWISNIAVTADNVTFTTTANTETTERQGTITVSYEGAEDKTVTVIQAAYVAPVPTTTYTLATSIESGRHYIIVAMDGDEAYAMGGQNNNNRAAVSITVEDGVAQVSSDDVYEFVINTVGFTDEIDPYFEPRSGWSPAAYPGYWKYTIYDAAQPGYLYAASSSNNYLKTETHLDANDNGVWAIEIYDENETQYAAHIAAFGDNTRKVMRYNSSNHIFSCYGTGNNMKSICLYVKDEDLPQYDFYKDVKGYGTSEGGYALMATPTTENANPNLVGMITDDGTDPDNFTYDLYGFDFTQDQEWRNYRSNAFNMNNGQGYLYANKNNVTLHFQGASYTSYKTVNLQFGNTNNHWNGWNLIGNPRSDVSWVGTSNFYVMNEAGTELELSNRSYVNPMEGIFVKATAANQSIYFADFWYYEEEWLDEILNIKVNGNNSSGDFARIRFGEGRNLEKFMLNQNHTKLYFTQGNKDFAVVRSANEGEMPVNFKAETNGNYTISVNAENVNMSYLHLIDNVTGADVDLLATPSYSFEANTNDYATRFRLVFKANANVHENADADADTFAFFNGNEWVVSNIGEATLQVVDVMGRVLRSETINGNAEISIKQEPGVYMLRLINGDNVKTQKVVVK